MPTTAHHEASTLARRLRADLSGRWPASNDEGKGEETAHDQHKANIAASAARRALASFRAPLREAQLLFAAHPAPLRLLAALTNADTSAHEYADAAH